METGAVGGFRSRVTKEHSGIRQQGAEYGRTSQNKNSSFVALQQSVKLGLLFASE